MVEKTKVNEIELVKSNTPADMIRLAITEKGDLDKLEKLLALQERYESNEAKKAYYKSMAEFKANPPKIDKDRTVAFATSAGKTSYNHASLGNVTEKIGAELSKYGLSASWTTKQNGAISVTCRITHQLGYSEETTITAPSDTSGSKNAIQAIGSTITYLERYTLLALCGLATYDQDDVGIAAGKPIEYIDKKELSQILDYLAELNADTKKFLAYMKLESLEKMPKADFQKAIASLEAGRKQKAGKK